MSDYIKREDVVNLGVMMQTHLWTREQAYNAIFCLPTADVAPVVRCEECKHLVVLNAQDLYAHCKRHDIRFEPFGYDTRTNYCSWAERKDDEL